MSVPAELRKGIEDDPCARSLGVEGRRAGFYDISVTAESGTVIALGHCFAHRVGPGRRE